MGHAQQLLFSCLCSKVTIYRRKWQCVFLDLSSHSSTLSSQFRIHWAGSQLNKKSRNNREIISCTLMRRQFLLTQNVIDLWLKIWTESSFLVWVFPKKVQQDILSFRGASFCEQAEWLKKCSKSGPYFGIGDFYIYFFQN